MHSLMVKKQFIANHFLIGGDWGNENKPHAHHYSLELIVEGATLDQHMYLVDIVRVEAVLEKLIETYRDKLLNGFTEFEGKNPSIELFSKILCTSLAEKIAEPRLSKIRVVLWEHDSAWAAYEIMQP